MSKQYGGKAWTELIWLKIGTSVGSCDHSNEPLGSNKSGKVLQ